MSSLTLSLSGNSSVLTANYFPPIELENREYVCGLIDLQTFNSIPNVDIHNNCFHFIHERGFVNSAKNLRVSKREHDSLCQIKIPVGSYEIDDIFKLLSKVLGECSVAFELKVNNKTLKCEVSCSHAIDFSEPNSIGSLLGFSKRILAPNVLQESDIPVDIFRVNALRIECSITTGAYMNDKPTHTIHEFCPTVPPGYKIIEVPHNVIYLPVVVRTIRTLTIKIVDQNNQLVNFNGETITIRIHIKKR